MPFLLSVVGWLAQPEHWQGTDGIPTRILEHLAISGLAVGVAAAIGVPIGVLCGHTGRGAFAVVNLANVGRAIPSMALLALGLPIAFGLGLGLGFWPTFIAMVPLGLPAILTNSFVGVREVPAELVEVARAMGMRERQVMLRAELPVAASLILAGIRNAAVAIVATATLGALVAGGGLGRYIVDGFARQESPRLFVGALLVALLAIATEVGLGLVERRVVSPGLRTSEPLEEERWSVGTR